MPPPPKPNSVPGALQQNMPLADILDKIARPPGSAPPFTPYRPVPRLVPLPDCHTLAVKHPRDLTLLAFGDLREDNLQVRPCQCMRYTLCDRQGLQVTASE